MSTWLVRRQDLPAVTIALENAGFVHGELLDVVMFRWPGGQAERGLHLLFANEKVRPDHSIPSPDIETVINRDDRRVIRLESLVTMKLLFNRDKDRTHKDMIGVGLIDQDWLAKVPAELVDRLKYVLDTRLMVEPT